MLKDLDFNEAAKYVTELGCSENNLMGKVNFYNLAKEESIRNEREKEIKELFKNWSAVSVTLISDDISIVKGKFNKKDDEYIYSAIVNGKKVMETCTETFDQALLLALMKKYNSYEGFVFTTKALGM